MKKCMDCPWNEDLFCDRFGKLLNTDDECCEEGEKIVNYSGYADPTAELAIGSKKKEKKDKILEAIGGIRKTYDDIADMMGYEIIGRITFKHKFTGKVFK